MGAQNSIRGVGSSASAPGRRMSRFANLALVCFILSGIGGSTAQSKKTIHTVFTTECNQYFNWQALAMYHSFKKSGQKGPITRLLSCTEEQLKSYKDVDGVPTHIAPSWSVHPRTGDHYSGINKPVAVRDWLEKVDPPEDYILIIDSDTIMREPFDVDEMGLKPGWAVSGFYGYLKGVNNELALKHIPHVPPRNDTLAGPYGRRSDQVGGFTFMSKPDLKRMASDWVTITEDVRADPDAWTLSGDSFTKQPGEKPWIAEMYGYSYAAAKADVWHHTNDKVMLYPGYMPLGINQAPKVLHYGIEFRVEKPAFSFDKHWYQGFQTLACPPWEVDEDGRPRGGLFPSAPHPSGLATKGLERLRDLLALEVAATLNEALCEHHRRHCPPSQELDSRCNEVSEVAAAVAAEQQALIAAPVEEACEDLAELCESWASHGECDKNQAYMHSHCKQACGLCAPKATQHDLPKVLDTHLGSTTINAKLVKAAMATAKANTAAVDVQQLKRICHSSTKLSLAEVKECLQLAQKGLRYEPRLATDRVGGLQARPNMAGEEVRKAAPGTVSRKLGEGASLREEQGRSLREEEQSQWEGGNIAVGAAGMLVLAFVVVFKVASRRSKPSLPYAKGGRRD